MDEPLSNLDARLRVAMREELRALQQAAGITTLYVTHDQEEALAISDRIAVMNAGAVEQVGTPREVYHRPATVFAAGFVGRMNFLPDPDASDDGQRAIRPEALEVSPQTEDAAPPGALAGEVARVTFLGAATQLAIRIPALDLELLAEHHHPDEALAPGAPVRVTLPEAAVHRFDAAGRRR